MFVSIGNRLVNLANVTEMVFEKESGAITISFGKGDYTRVPSTQEGYDGLRDWMQSQPTLEDILDDEDEEDEESSRSFDAFDATLEHSMTLLKQYESDVLGAVSPELRNVFDHFETVAELWFSGKALA